MKYNNLIDFFPLESKILTVFSLFKMCLSTEYELDIGKYKLSSSIIKSGALLVLALKSPQKRMLSFLIN
jgi:hypothetical protein